jgi:hypothetical protein
VVYGGGALVVAQLCLVVYCVLNIITTPEDQIRNLPKLLWLVLVLLFPIIGGVAWLVAGRPQGSATSSMPYKGNRGLPPEYDRPGRAVASSPDDDEAFLRSLRERAEEQRRKAEQERRLRESEPEA